MKEKNNVIEMVGQGKTIEWETKPIKDKIQWETQPIKDKILGEKTKP